MTINEYQQAALRTESINSLSITGYSINTKEGSQIKYRPAERLLQGLMGLNGEAGEALDLLKKTLFQGHTLDVEHVAKELGDVAWYLALAADAIGYDLETIFQMNIDKLMARYPDGFDSGRSIFRTHNDV